MRLVSSAIAITVLVTAFGSAAASTPPDVPGDSFVSMSDALRAEALTVLGAFTKEKHACETPKVLDTRGRKAAGKVKMDGEGRLTSGTITESWKVDVCGKSLSLVVVLAPPATEGASSVTVTEKS
jgi:hypothetical protein